MDRREFLKLVVTTAAYISTPKPLAAAFNKASNETGYKDDLILRMYEEGTHVVIETRRRVTVRECLDLKHEWEKSIGLFRHGNPMDFDKRDVFVRPMSEEMPPNAEFLCDVEDAWTMRKTGAKKYIVKYPDERGGGEVMMDEIRICTMMPNPGPTMPWTGDYRAVDEEE